MYRVSTGLLIALISTALFAQSQPPAPQGEQPNSTPQASPSGPAFGAKPGPANPWEDEVQPSPSWNPGPDFLKNAHAACDNAKQPPSFAECFIDQMPKNGAPAEAVNFTRALYKATGDVGIAIRTTKFYSFGMAAVMYPLRANDNNGIMFINTDPNFINVDDLSKLDKNALTSDKLYQQWKQQYPQLELWPGDRVGAEPMVLFARNYPTDDPNVVHFLFTYPLKNGCHACANIGYVNYWWEFTRQGKFVATKLVSVSKVQPPIKRGPPRHLPPPPPAATPQQPGAATPPATTPTAQTPQMPAGAGEPR